MSKTDEAIRENVQKGLTVRDGVVFGIRGKPRKTRIAKYRNYSREAVSLALNGQSRPVPVAKIVAYLKFGEAVFESEIQVRHLDGNSLNNQSGNIAIGSASDNMMDIPKEKRQNHAEHAASSLRKYSDKTEDDIVSDYSKGFGYKKLSKRYKIPKSTIRAILVRRGLVS